MTLGPALFLLWAVDGRTPRLLRPALMFGKVPLFYYLTHFALIHVLAVVVCYLRYGTAHWMFESPDLATIHSPRRPAGDSRCRWCTSVGVSGDRDVPVLRVVRTAEATAERRVAQLLLRSALIRPLFHRLGYILRRDRSPSHEWG